MRKKPKAASRKPGKTKANQNWKYGKGCVLPEEHRGRQLATKPGDLFEEYKGYRRVTKAGAEKVVEICESKIGQVELDLHKAIVEMATFCPNNVPSFDSKASDVSKLMSERESLLRFRNGLSRVLAEAGIGYRDQFIFSDSR